MNQNRIHMCWTKLRWFSIMECYILCDKLIICSSNTTVLKQVPCSCRSPCQHLYFIDIKIIILFPNVLALVYLEGCYHVVLHLCKQRTYWSRVSNHITCWYLISFQFLSLMLDFKYNALILLWYLISKFGLQL